MAAAVVVPAVVLQLVSLLVIGFVLTVQGSTGDSIAPAPAFFSEIPPLEGTPGTVHDRKPWKSSAPSPASQQNGSSLHPPNALPPLMSAPVPQTVTGPLPTHSPETPTPIVTPPLIASPPPLIIQGHVPSLSPAISIISPAHDNPGSNVHTRPALSPLIPTPDPPTVRGLVPSSSHVTPIVTPPNSIPPLPFMPPFSIAPPPLLLPNSVSPPPSIFQGHVPSLSTSIPIESPPNNIAPPPLLSEQHAQPMPQNASRREAPVRKPADSAPAATPSGNFPQISPVMHPGTPRSSQPGAHARNVSLHGASSPKPISPGQNVSHASSPPSIHLAKGGAPVAAPPDKTSQPPSSANNPSPKGTFSATAPSKAVRHSSDAPAPSLSIHISPQNNESNSPAPSPHHWYREGNKSNPSSPQQSHEGNKTSSVLPASSYPTSPTSSKEQGPVSPPPFLPTIGHSRYAPPPLSLGSPSSTSSTSPHPFTKPVSYVSPVPSPSPIPSSGWTTMPVLPPKVSPASSPISPKRPPPVQALPPPPPNEDCSTTVCTEPYTNTPPGSPCGCVLPMQVGLRLSVALYTFFPLVSELAQEIATGVFMKLSQVRIIGANAASQEPEKTIVLIDLVPLGKRFDNTTAFLTYQRFWHKEVVIKASFFGDYEVLYVRYQGLPPSPPTAPSGIGIIDDGPYPDNGNNGRAIKPLGVDVSKRQHKDGLGNGMIAIITLSGFVALVLCSAVAWVFLCRQRDHDSQPVPPLSLPSHAAKPSGTLGSAMGSGLSSASLSFGSSIATYTGSAKTFSTSDLERATNNFDASRILGEGGFGLVYSGVLEDGTKIAVKILKRDDQQGGREFLAEVEMLSRLHHRNLVKLIGICTEEGARSLVYELIPNGSVESHLHGIDKESAPLNWDARMKIALGAARGLAYLHEDSSPRVIHRDFKASNILLEHDFTPKVSDFGLARTAMDEASRHISTRVMGTFGYVAPEYAMTGHLLVKSDVYSYGVVLLELLSGRKPVDMSQPAGQENLVAWARPLLTSKEGLEIMVDPSLGPDVPFDSVAKVAAIASMCVQPEVSHRPFMGEVVQALKLVCNECDEAKEGGSRSSSRDMSADMDGGVSSASGQLPDPFQNQTQVPNYDSEPDIERGLPMSDMYATSARYWREASGSFKRCSSSGPLTAGKGRQLWQRLRGLTGGSVSEHGIIFKSWPGSH